jgi:hypothetical protein
MTYSQLNQDDWILSKFDENYKGFYVEVGAGDGIYLSDTYALELKGWTGICIEPDTEQFDKLQKARTSQNFKCCISDFTGKCEFRENKLWGKIVNKNCGTMDCFTLGQFLDNANAPRVIDYLSLDVEGGEFVIVKDFPFEKYFIKYITVEHNAHAGDSTLKNNLYSVLSLNFFLEKENVGGFEDWYRNKLLGST